MSTPSFTFMSHGSTLAASHASGPVRSNTTSEAVATTPTDKRGFVTSESLAGAGASGDCLRGFGRGGPTREDGRTGSGRV